MKQTLLISLLVFTFFGVQKANAQGFNSGLKVGVNFTQVDGDDMGGYKKIGFNGGLFVKYDFGKRSAMQFELLYAGKGSKSSLNTKSESYDHREIKLHYIDIPIFYSFAIIEPLRIEAGVVPSVLIKSEDLWETAGEFKRLDLGGMLGVNYQFTESFSITGRFIYSFVNIRKSPDQSMKSLFGSGQFNNAVSLTMNYHF